MAASSRIFKIEQDTEGRMAWGDVVVIIGIAGLLYLGVRLASGAAEVVKGPEISLSPAALPIYAALSLGRMTAAYVLSILFSLVYGYYAAYKRWGPPVLLPILDVLQSVPILSFLPVVLLSLTAILPQGVATEIAAIVLIFTSQAWNMTFSWYQSLITIPNELKEASTIFQFNPIMRFRVLQLPFAAIGLIWNSMMSWAGGWFFLMAAEIFTVGKRDFRLQGLGAYLQEAANQGNMEAIIWGVGVLILVIVLLDQLVWRPLLAWSNRFKLEMVEGDVPFSSWFYNALHNSHFIDRLHLDKLWRSFSDKIDTWSLRYFPMTDTARPRKARYSFIGYLLAAVAGICLIYGVYRAGQMLWLVPSSQWSEIVVGVGATMLRVTAALVITLAWTVPVGVAIGTNPRLATVLQPLVQIAASIPATALFPVFLIVILKLPGGLSLAAVFLMLLGTQWYMLFNIIAGAAVIPQDLKYTSILMHMSRWERWRILILPTLFPYIITGGIAAGGGAWNASIVAEYVRFGGHTVNTTGIGAVIAKATAAGNYPLLLAATLSMILTVVMINRFGWRRLYRLAQERYRLE
jgi:NitT/TauT family transport system permease protein